MEYIHVNDIIFKGKQNIRWDQVEKYISRYFGRKILVKEYQDLIQINYAFASEFAGSKYTEHLHGGLAKTKANIVQVIPELIENATNRRWNENHEPKHNKNACKGWYRYDVFFSIPVKDEQEVELRRNYYKATMIVRWNDEGLFLHDIINIKKETRTPRES